MIYWSEFLIPYETAVEELKNKLKAIRNECRRKNQHSPIEFVVGRVKQVPSIIEKAQKLGISEDEIDKVDDIAGIRVICQFESDIYEIVELLRAREGMDLEIVLEKDYIKEVKDSGYRSYHMVVRYPVFTLTGMRLILIEIQIRTMAMNFWATVEHSLRYKYKEALPPYLMKKLKAAAEAVYEIDSTMQEIRDEIMSAQMVFMHKSNTVSQIINNISLLEKMDEREAASNFRMQFEQLNYDQSPNLNFDERLEQLAEKTKEAIAVKNKTAIQRMEDLEKENAAAAEKWKAELFSREEGKDGEEDLAAAGN